jgi:hypothetical protein
MVDITSQAPAIIADLEKQKHEAQLRLDELVKTVASFISPVGETVVWIGSGLSVGCGYPGWSDAVEALCEVCIPGKADITPSMLGQELLTWAQRCKDADPEEYTKTLERLFSGYPKSLRTAYSSICGCPFRFLVTTNFDYCLAMASGREDGILTYPDIRLLPNHSTSTVVYLHGRARNGSVVDASALLFTANELDDAYAKSFIPSTLHSLLGSFPCIFVGCGLEEAVLENLFAHLKGIHKHTRIPEQKKVILLPEEPDSNRRDAQFKKMQELGVEILRYPLDEAAPCQNRYHYLDEIWAMVRDEIRQSKESQLLREERIR